ncbi:hypothetical protein C6990_06375 [Nitrosopumilus sp. b3]|uniref:hypothetical protein n=1 Tax=Nitrosopumilus sp. b3 TaxID=2109909 RepID=UPI0015F70838|nr:hypothetical protein [Nitrosopumilus sp. b3]KAF6246742.1 hypothetical protein C6990_06375 [Nitrosopumilus sp. b3]
MKANFKIKKDEEQNNNEELSHVENKVINDEEFENYIKKTGAAGSFMVFRNFKKKQDELGIDEI